jgi:hypothetical protein
LIIYEILIVVLFGWSRDGIYWRETLSRWEKEHDSWRKVLDWLYWNGVAMAFIEWKLFHDKRRILTVYERLPVDFICTESRLDLLKGSSSTIRQASWPFTKGSSSILFAPSRDEINWMRALPRWEKEFDRLRNTSVNCICIESWWYLLNGSSSTIREATWPFTKGSRPFYLHRLVMTSIEWGLFHDERSKLTVYERLIVDFIYTESR